MGTEPAGPTLFLVLVFHYNFSYRLRRDDQD